MEDTLTFVSWMLAILLSYMIWKLWGKNWVEYFKTKDGLGILRGIVLAVVGITMLGALIWLFTGAAFAGTWVNDASVFAGLEQTRKQSPMCEQNTVDDRGTSNLGAVLNIWQSDSKRVRVNAKYTHHSCALGADDRQYDAAGIEVHWKVWER